MLIGIPDIAGQLSRVMLAIASFITRYQNGRSHCKSEEDFHRHPMPECHKPSQLNCGLVLHLYIMLTC